jgi:hypothetical protein
MSEPAKDEAELMEQVAKAFCCPSGCIDNTNCDKLDFQIDAIRALAAIRAAGWAVVPVEPTEEMLHGFTEPNGYICSLDWEAILAASPIPPGVKP